MTTRYLSNAREGLPTQVQAIVFDLDGTLIDTLGDLAFSVNEALAAHKLPKRSVDEVRAFTGNGIRLLIERSAPSDIDSQTLEAVFSDFKHIYAEHNLDTTAPYPGIPELVYDLTQAGIACCVASNKADFAVQKIVDTLMPGAFQAVAGEREGIPKKPDPTMVDTMLNKLSLTREKLIYIGDSEVDLAMARALEVPSIVCTWGFRSREQLKTAGATLIVDSVSELRTLLLG